MKKMKFLVATLLLTGATFSGYRAYESYVTSQDELLMLNLAALANNEGGNNNGETNNGETTNGNSESGNSNSEAGSGNNNSESSIPSNQNGSGMYFYPTLASKGSQKCLLYIIFRGGVEAYVTDKPKGELGIDYFKGSGLEELCPLEGNGCTVYSCHKTKNTY